MKKLFFVLLIAFPISSLADETVATCKDPSGYSNYHYSGFVPKEKSGVVDDKVTGGITTLVKTGANEYDLLFTDTRETIISANGDGGKVPSTR